MDKPSNKQKMSKEDKPTKGLKYGVSPTGMPVASGSAKDVLDALPKIKFEPKERSPEYHEQMRRVVEEAKKLINKDDISVHPTHIKEMMVRHKGVIPHDHPDRQKMVDHINELMTSNQRGEGVRLYQQYISGKGYTKSDDLNKTEIVAETYTDGTIEVTFSEGVSEILEKAIVTYLSSQGYDEILEKGLKAEHKSKKGGMTASGVKAYRRENPGSKLQTAVTEDKPTGKRAKRRRSFCSRMSGVKGPMKDKQGKPTRKALALRRWKC